MFQVLPILLVLAAGQLGDARKFIISNQCKAPVWAAYTAVSGGNGIKVNGKAGTGMWLQASGQKDELDVPETFSAGKFWAATGCNEQGTGCKIGGCPDGKCDGTQIGQSGATLAEFTLPGTETFDISITDGFNVPIAITPTGGTGEKCNKVSCGATTDLLTKCHPALAFPFGSDTVWSCFNPCTAGVQYKTGAVTPFVFTTAKSCCPDNDKATCKTDTDVPFYDTMKAACNDGFVYPPETEMNHECKGPEYLIEFCPGGKGIGANPSGNAPVNQCAGPGGAIVGGGSTGTNSDRGGSFDGLPAGAGEACDGSTTPAVNSAQDSSETALTGAIPGAGTAAVSGGATGAGSGAAAGTGAVGAGSAAGAVSTQAAASANAGAGTGAVESPAAVDPPAPAPAASTPAAIVPAPAVSSAAAPALAAPAASIPVCKGRHCRSGGVRGRGNEARRLAKAVEERDGECAAR